jgi:hypothetical protein
LVTLGWAIVALLAVLALIELLTWAAVRRFRPKFQWLITRRDIAPAIDGKLLDKHINGSFDPEIGWAPRPHSTGTDETSDVAKTYSIDERGRRSNPGFERHRSTVAVFGDSFAFCRMVNDDETWPHFLSRDLDTNVQNFGAGNYGIDQTCLRLRREIANGSVTNGVVILTFTPETISRIRSYWRHYYEYGNILGFKPRFELRNDELVLRPQAATTRREFETYSDRLEEIQSIDPFYRRKFLRDLNRFPFSLRLITRWRRLPRILWHLTLGEVTGRRAAAWRRAMDVVLWENAREAARLYRDPGATDLLRRIVSRTAQACREAGVVPIVVVMPQPVDIENGLVATAAYRRCMTDIRSFVELFDLSEILVADRNWRDLFTDGLRGPHFHKQGNRFVASAIRPLVERHLSVSRGSAGATTASALADPDGLSSAAMTSGVRG